MRYYVVSDVHGFYKELMSVLTEKGFFEDKEPHKLVVCGDLFDRGTQACKLQDFILDLMKKDEIILVRGNHEDLALEFLHNMHEYLRYKNTATHSHHYHNGTIGTFEQLTQIPLYEMIQEPLAFAKKAFKTPYINDIIPKMVNYYETSKYIFVHGWIPCTNLGSMRNGVYYYEEDWREATDSRWSKARWYNGMDCCDQGVKEQGKTIVCGHWHSSYGHFKFGDAESEYGLTADYSPFYAEGIIALDACTAYSGKMNCIVIDD